MSYFWLGILAEDIEPYCDGDFESMECVEDDGDITCYFSGPIRAINIEQGCPPFKRNN